MNAKIRKMLEELENQLFAIKDELQTIRDDELDKYDNMPEGFKCGNSGNIMETAISELEDAIGNLDSAIENIGNARG